MVLSLSLTYHTGGENHGAERPWSPPLHLDHSQSRQRPWHVLLLVQFAHPIPSIRKS